MIQSPGCRGLPPYTFGLADLVEQFVDPLSGYLKGLLFLELVDRILENGDVNVDPGVRKLLYCDFLADLLS